MIPHVMPKPPIVPNADANPPVRIDVEAWLGHSHEAVLIYRGQEYRLRITRLGKLILNK